VIELFVNAEAAAAASELGEELCELTCTNGRGLLLLQRRQPQQ
jgi:hypothetical protein